MLNRNFKKLLLMLMSILAVSSVLIYSTQVKKAAAQSGEGQKVINVAAASDLQYAFNDIGNQFTKRSGIKVVFNFGSTGLLARQIENGAPIDVFAAASMKYIDTLREKDLVDSGRVCQFARGRLVLVFKTNSLQKSEPEEMIKSGTGKFAIANPKHAPYGEAAVQFLNNMGVWADVRDRVVYGNNVRDTLAFVKTGNAEAGIAALSLVINEQSVSYTVLDEKSHSPIVQGAAIIKNNKSGQAAGKFIDYLKSDEAGQILHKYGFETVNDY